MSVRLLLVMLVPHLFVSSAYSQIHWSYRMTRVFDFSPTYMFYACCLSYFQVLTKQEKLSKLKKEQEFLERLEQVQLAEE